MKPRNIYRIIIGILMAISGFAAIAINGENRIIGTLFLCAGLAFLITGILRHRRYGDDPESDERSKKIGACGITYAWMTGLFFMTALYWLNYTGILILNTQNALAVSILILVVSAVLFQMWLYRKGDVG